MKNKKRLSTIMLGMLCAFAMFMTSALHMGIFTNTKDKAMVDAQSIQPQSIIQGNNGDGDGSSLNPFLIGTQAMLRTRLEANAHVANRHFVLIDDIDLVGAWNPIPNFAATNVFNGQGFTIRGLNISGVGNNRGFFGILHGTVRNLNFENVSITSATGQGIGTLAGTAQSHSARVENVRVLDGTITMTGAGRRIGGLVGGVMVAETTLRMYDVYNGANIFGGTSWGIGGILGHIGQSASANTRVYVTRAMNTGNIISTRSGNSYSGGIVSINEGGHVTINWAINRGHLTLNNHSGGILGGAWSAAGSSTVRNSINDAPLTLNGTNQGGVLSRNNGIVTLENTWFSNNLYGGLLINNTTSTTLVGGTANNGGAHSTTIRTQSWLEDRNLSEWFIIVDGNLAISSLARDVRLLHTFLPGAGVGEPITIREYTDEQFTVPYAGMQGFVTPTRTGYIFSGWSNNEGFHADLMPGEPFTNTGTTNLNFTAMFRPAVFDIELAGDGTTIVSGGNTITIEDVSRIATNSSFAAGWHWLVRVRNTENFVDVTPITNPESLNISNLFNEQFITDNAYFYGPVQSDRFGQPPVGSVGRIEIRAVNEATSTLVHTVAPVRGGTLSIVIDNDNANPRLIALGNSVALPTTGQITRLIVTELPHFTFVNIQKLDASNNPIGAPLTGLSIDTAWDLNLMQGFTIAVNFEAIVYTFNIFGAVEGDYVNPINGAVTINHQTGIEIGGDAVVDVTATPMVGELRFVGWKMRLADGTFVRLAGGVNFSHTFNNIDTDFLTRYLPLSSNQITIVAEFAPTHLVSVNMEAGQMNFGSIVVEVIDTLTGLHIGSSINDLNVSQGSRVIIYINPNQNGVFELDRVTGLPHISDIVSNTGRRIEFNVNGPLNITVFFIERQFDIVFRAVENEVNPVTGVTGFVATIDGVTSTTIGFGESLQNLIAGPGSERTGFRFVNFSIYDENGNRIVLDLENADKFISLDLLLENLVFINEVRSFIITANYVRTFVLDVRNAIGSEEMGGFYVYEVVGTDEVRVDPRTHEFVAGSTAIVRANAHNFHSLASITGGGNLVFDSATGSATITNIRASSPVAVHFNTIEFDLETVLGSGIIINRYEDLQPWNTVRLSVTPPGGQQIATWRINGLNVNDILAHPVYGRYVTRIDDNTVDIRLSVAILNWFEVTPGSEQFRITSTVDFGMTTGVLLAILIPGILIPLLLAAAAVYFLRSRKKYASIKAELVAANKQKLMFNQAAVIQDLKDGKSAGQVTDADVKQAMKDKKNKK